jgi:hypothetical protein
MEHTHVMKTVKTIKWKYIEGRRTKTEEVTTTDVYVEDGTLAELLKIFALLVDEDSTSEGLKRMFKPVPK